MIKTARDQRRNEHQRHGRLDRKGAPHRQPDHVRRDQNGERMDEIKGKGRRAQERKQRRDMNRPAPLQLDRAQLDRLTGAYASLVPGPETVR